MVVVQLESQLEELHLVDLRGRRFNKHLEGDSLTERVAMWAAEAQVHVVHLAVGDRVVVGLDWHCHLELLLSADAESDRDVDEFERNG